MSSQTEKPKLLAKPRSAGGSSPSTARPGSGTSAVKRPARASRSVPQEPQTKDLLVQLGSIQEELKKEKENRSYFQLERDKLNQYWDITKAELKELHAQLRNKDREMEEMEERHQVEIKVYKQKVKHLFYEHQNNITQLKTEDEETLKLAHDDNRTKEQGMRKQTRKTKGEMKELEIAHEDVVKNLKQEHDKSITKLRQEFDRNAKELHLKYERKMKQLRGELDLRRKNELHEIEERKNAHINQLMTKHDAAFDEMKTYYNDITANNLELIRSLKDKIEIMKKTEATDQKMMLEVNLENKRLTEPLQRAVKEVDLLRADLANYQKDKESLIHAKTRVKVLESEMKTLKWEHEVLEQRFAKLQKERDELYDKFVTSIYEVQQKSGLKNLLLEKKLQVVSNELDTREAQLSQVMNNLSVAEQEQNEAQQRVASHQPEVYAQSSTGNGGGANPVRA